MNRNSPIGIFDSGLGGLTVLKKIQRLLPDENFIYFGDTAHLPYGSKSNECIIEYSEKIVNFLINQNVKAIIIACNSASSVAKEKIQNKTGIPVFEVISPAVHKAISATKTNHICVIGTETTINSKVYSNALLKLNEGIYVSEIACPLFVPLIEEGLENDIISNQAVKLYLNTIVESDIDTIILGCTHYPIIKNQLSNILSNNIKYITSGTPVGEHLKRYLTAMNLFNNQSSSFVKFYVSDSVDKFKRLGSRFLNSEIVDVDLIQL